MLQTNFRPRRRPAWSGLQGRLRTGALALLLLGSAAAQSAHTVRPGDTLSAIATRYGVNLGQLQAANPGLRNPNSLQIGQRLNLPGRAPAAPARPAGSVHTVARGDSLSAIASRHGVGLQALLAANPGVSAARPIVPGQRLNVPARSAAATPAGLNPASLSAALWLWPVAGRISSAFGNRVIEGHAEFHDGIDIAAYHGSDVRAARAGRVVEARMDARTGWGNTVLIDHGDGFTTRYAHLSGVGVRLGQAVARGQVVGQVGNTGRSFGTHLHYSIYFQGRALDPLLVRP